MLGLRELVMVAAVVLVLYGRSGVLQSRDSSPSGRGSRRSGRKPTRPGSRGSRRPDGLGHVVRIAPGAATADRPADPERSSSRGNRLFWFLTILAATAVATSIITRVLIVSAAGPGVAP